MTNKEIADLLLPGINVTPEEIEAQAHAYQIAETVVTKARVKKILNKLVDEDIIPTDWDEKCLGTIAKHLPKLIFEDCIKEEPETVQRVADFGKIASKLCMKNAREILEGIE